MKHIKRIIVLLLCATMLVAFVGCKDKPAGDQGKPSGGVTTTPTVPSIITAEIVIKDYGKLKIELYPQLAPQSVYNFVYLARNNFYNGVIVHRIVKDACIQTGAYGSGFVARTPEKGEYTIKGEFSGNGVENKLSMGRGMLAWARVGSDFDSASTQFFICLDTANTQGWNGSYAPFGKVVEGLDVLDKINKLKLSGEKPKKEVLITLVTIDGPELPEPTFIMKNS